MEGNGDLGSIFVGAKEILGCKREILVYFWGGLRGNVGGWGKSGEMGGNWGGKGGFGVNWGGGKGEFENMEWGFWGEKRGFW